MRIIAVVNQGNAVSYHRLIMPLMLMDGPDVFITNNLLEEHFEKGCDVLMYNRILPLHSTEKIATLQKKYGFKIVIDIDDYWHLDEHHVLYEEYRKTDFATQQIWHIENADAVLCTHERLAAEIKPFNKNVHVMPNAIPKQGQFNTERIPHHLTRLFWQGSDTHRKDISILRGPANALSMIAPKIQMVMAGFADGNEQWDSMVMDYTASLRHQYKLIPFEPVHKYYEAYQHADICLIPLIDSPFNKHKSNLKVLEAANLGLPVICSKVNPYLDLPVIYASNAGEWVYAIRKLAGSRKRQKEAGAVLKDYCDKHYNFGKINNERKQVIEYEAGKQNIS